MAPDEQQRLDTAESRVSDLGARGLLDPLSDLASDTQFEDLDLLAILPLWEQRPGRE